MKAFYYSLFIIFVLSLNELSAQNSPPYNNYYNHSFLINPASGGVYKFPMVCGSFMRQWMGVPESPSTQIMSYAGRIGRYNFYNPKQMLNKSKYNGRGRVGLAFAVYNDKNGPIRNQGLNSTYSYHIPVNHKRDNLSFGISGILSSYIYDVSELSPHDEGDNLLQKNELYFAADANVGVLYTSEDYTIGVAVNDLFETMNYNSMASDGYFDKKFILHGEYNFKIKSYFNLEPAVVLRYLDQSFKGDFHARLKYKRYTWVGISLLNLEQFKTTMVFKVNRCHVGYAYNQIFSKFSGNSYGSHEILLGYNIGMRGYRGHY